MICDIPLAFTSSETLYDHQRAMIEKVFNCQVYDHYGTTERTIRLEEDFNHDGYFEDPGYGIVEYHDGYTLSTSLINTAFPLIRYRTDDRITLKDTTVKTKENFIDCIDGRNEDYIVCKDGTKLMRLGFVVKDVERLDKSQIVQTREGEVEIRVVPSKKGLATDAINTIRRRMEERCGKDNMEVTIRQVSDSELIYSNKRKFKYVHSEIHRGGDLST